MTITLITEEQYNKLLEIQQKHPILTFENDGYENFDKSKMTDEDKKAFDEVTEILKNHIKGFSEFQNFKHSKKGNLRIRFQYNWEADSDKPGIPFIGVGYLDVKELLNGFNKI